MANILFLQSRLFLEMTFEALFLSSCLFAVHIFLDDESKAAVAFWNGAGSFQSNSPSPFHHSGHSARQSSEGRAQPWAFFFFFHFSFAFFLLPWSTFSEWKLPQWMSLNFSVSGKDPDEIQTHFHAGRTAAHWSGGGEGVSPRWQMGCSIVQPAASFRLFLQCRLSLFRKKVRTYRTLVNFRVWHEGIKCTFRMDEGNL